MIKSRWKRNVEPPTLPSELIALALRDIKWVEKHPKYFVKMETWRSGCGVCFAGSVMTRRFKITDGRCTPCLFTTEWANAFWALDRFRLGAVTEGLRHLGIRLQFDDTEIFSVDVCPYEHDPDSFKRDIGNLITLLQREGL